MARLINLTSTDETYSIGNIFRIGRHPGNDLMIKDSLVSRHHAEIRKEGERYLIADLGSLNATVVNGEQIKEMSLRDDDRIKIGSTELLFKIKEEPDKAQKKAEIFHPGKDDIVKSANIMELSSSGGGAFEWESLFDPSHKNKPKTPVSPHEKAQIPKSLMALYQLARSINGANDKKALLDISLNLIMDIFNADRAVIMLLDEHDNIKPASWKSKNRYGDDEVFVSSTITNKVIKDKVSVLTQDARLDPRFVEGVSISTYNIRAALCVPLWEGKKTMGVLYLDNLLITKAFTESELDCLTAMAYQIAMGIRHHDAVELAKEEAIKRSYLERYHSPDMVNIILSQSQEEQRLELEAQEREVTVLFSDIAGFTPLVEQLKPSEIANLLNHYFDEMTKVIFNCHGTINKFIGDAIMALFGAPFSHGNDAELAVKSAVEMMKALGKFSKKIDKAKRFSVRIGINTGDVIVGNIGSTNMLEYTAIGDPVNIASRLEKLAKPNTILIGAATYNKLENKYPVKDMGRLELKGKKELTKAYEVQWQQA